MKYKTKPIDYTNCHPVIAEHLKRGEAIECRVWSTDRATARTQMIQDYVADRQFPYISAEGQTSWAHAEPIPIKQKFRKASEIIKWLEDKGWEYNSTGERYHYGNVSVRVFDILDVAGEEMKTADQEDLAMSFPEWLEDKE